MDVDAVMPSFMFEATLSPKTRLQLRKEKEAEAAAAAGKDNNNSALVSELPLAKRELSVRAKGKRPSSSSGGGSGGRSSSSGGLSWFFSKIAAAITGSDEGERDQPAAKRARRTTAPAEGPKDDARRAQGAAGKGAPAAAAVAPTQLREMKKFSRKGVALTPNREGNSMVEKIGMADIAKSAPAAVPLALAAGDGSAAGGENDADAAMHRTMPASMSANLTPRRREQHRKQLRQYYNLSPLTPTSRQRRYVVAKGVGMGTRRKGRHRERLVRAGTGAAQHHHAGAHQRCHCTRPVVSTRHFPLTASCTSLLPLPGTGCGGSRMQQTKVSQPENRKGNATGLGWHPYRHFGPALIPN